jgi:hypothetical protein
MLRLSELPMLLPLVGEFVEPGSWLLEALPAEVLPALSLFVKTVAESCRLLPSPLSY